MKASFILVLLLIVLSCEAEKKRKKRFAFNLKDLFRNKLGLQLRGTTEAPPTTPAPTTKKVHSQTQYFVTIDAGVDLRTAINSTKKFYEIFKTLPHLPQHKNGSKLVTGGHSSSASFQDESLFWCASRPTLLSIPRPPYGQGFVWPACAVVNRCAGCCASYELQSCKPRVVIKKEIGYYHVEPLKYNDIKVTPKSIWFDDEPSCDCFCIKTPDSCNQLTQTLNEDVCACECKPEHKQDKMNCLGNFKYDPEQCKCECALETPAADYCGKDKHWSHDDCSCVRI